VIRDIEIEKSVMSEQLGISIEDGIANGVFVSGVNPNSLASLVGLMVSSRWIEMQLINVINRWEIKFWTFAASI